MKFDAQSVGKVIPGIGIGTSSPLANLPKLSFRGSEGTRNLGFLGSGRTATPPLLRKRPKSTRFPIREKSCQAPFYAQFSSSPSLQTKYKVWKMARLPPRI